MRARSWKLSLTCALLGCSLVGCGVQRAPASSATPPAVAPALEAPAPLISAPTPTPELASAPPAAPEATPSYPEGAVDDQLEDSEPGFSLALGELSDGELERLLADDPQALGGLSIGGPSSGVLVGGERMPEDAEWKLVDPARAYGTRETCDFLAHAIHKVNRELPGGHPLYIGHISAKSGGHLNPHKSHQAGRDVDISFYYQGEDAARWYKRGTADNLDLPRTWSFVRALISDTDVEMILIDHSIQKLLYDYAQSIGEDQTWLDNVFHGQAGKQRALILHAPGHATHIHIRFYNPIAQEAARRLYPKLIASGKIHPPAQYVSYVAKKGDTLIKLAKRFNTTVKAIKQANGLRGTLIRAKVTYKIPKQSGVSLPPRPRIPERRVPPVPDKRDAAGTEAKQRATSAAQEPIQRSL
ncbi:MAG: penicillin-insensitive murein endopeptidase [Polyangiaceae bacterium]